MKIGIVLPTTTADTDRVLSVARSAETLGYDGVFASDHLFPPGGSPERPSLEAFATLAAVAAATTRVTIGTLVARASLRHAGMLARQAATIAELSGGRFVLGIGSGDSVSRPEHDAFGIGYMGRGPRRAHLAETAGAVRALLEGREWPGGEHVPRIEGPLLPHPRERDRPPIWIGGRSEQMVRLAAEVADGWNGWGLSSGAFGARSRLLASAAGGRAVVATWGGIAVVGRDQADAERLLSERRERGLSHTWAGGAASAVRWLGELREAGAAWAIALLGGPRDRLELVGELVLPQVRAWQ